MAEKCTIIKILLLATMLLNGGIVAALNAHSGDNNASDRNVGVAQDTSSAQNVDPYQVADSGRSVEDVIDVICADWTEGSDVEIEEIKTTLLELYESPINLNTASSDDLRKIPFLTENQIDDILLYAYRHPMDSIYELMLIPSLRDYEARDLMYFVSAENPMDSSSSHSSSSSSSSSTSSSEKLYAREVFRYARQELLLRADARNIEDFKGDPAYAQVRYRFNYKNRVQFGATIRRNPGASARDLQYGGYLQLNNFGPLKTLVAGNFQADFGCGLVTSSAFHMGKSAYVLNAGMRPEGLRKYASVDGAGLHGLGATFTMPVRNRDHTLETSAFYSLQKTNDSIRKHVVGMNLTYRWNRLKLGVTAVEKIYSDTLRYFRDQEYNKNYFRGTNQAVLGLNARYNWGRFDLFGEVAMAQSSYTILSPRWGFGTNVGLRVTPVSNVGLMLLYRYYSPTFDNDLGYGFSESSRLGDEHGIYLAADVRCVRHWRWAAYVDLYRFSGQKYQIAYAPSYGYDVLLQTDWTPNLYWNMSLRGRVREKGGETTFLVRYQFRWNRHNWLLTTRADYTRGYAIFQDARYTFQCIPLQLGARLCGFNVQNYNWRIYAYEDDVLESFSIPALYGRGGRAYLNLRWQILDHRNRLNPSVSQLVLYFRASETLYSNDWAVLQKMTYRNRTDLHLLLRLTF